MRAFVGFLWSQKGDYSAWNWNLNKEKLIYWVQSEYAIASMNSINGICFSKLFNNLSDIRKYKANATGNELKVIDEFLKYVETCPKEVSVNFIDNHPHDK